MNEKEQAEMTAQGWIDDRREQGARSLLAAQTALNVSIQLFRESRDQECVEEVQRVARALEKALKFVAEERALRYIEGGGLADDGD